MQYLLLSQNMQQGLLERLLSVRNITDSIDDFLHPTYKKYRHDPFLLHDMEKGVERLITARKKNQRIMIFADYDVDGITASFILFTFFTKFLTYTNISIQFPDRVEDGYGLKQKHIDLMLEKQVDVIVTVDNGITSVQEAIYAKKKGIDLLITDHHEAGEEIPAAYAVINPKISTKYPCSALCGAGVVYKCIAALLTKSRFSEKQKQEVMEYFLPIVTIATVTDVVPLVNENRLLVKKGLQQINEKKNLPDALKGFLRYVKLEKDIDTYHIGFVLGPRLNAGGRIHSPHASLAVLLTTGEKQRTHLDFLESRNEERKKLQEEAYKVAEKQIDSTKKILIASDPSFHEGIVGIVAGKLTEKYYKPSIIFTRNEEKGIATGSVRGPDYFNVIAMIHAVQHLLARSGGHKQAGGMTVLLDRFEELCTAIYRYCDIHIGDALQEKIISVDTQLHANEWDETILEQIEKCGPYGEGNPEPVFLLTSCQICSVAKIGKNGKGHLKLRVQFGANEIGILFWSQGDQKADYPIGEVRDFYGKIKKDTFNGGYFLEGV